MANTFSCINIHCVFSTKERASVLAPDIRERLWPYMGGIAKQNGIFPKCIGGVADHVHLLLALPTTMAIAKALQLIKTGSSAWIHQTLPTLRNFAWQQGYGAFSVGISQIPETIQYIEQQSEHHRTRTFKEEYLAFLKKHGGNLDEKYLWTSNAHHPVPYGTGLCAQAFQAFHARLPSGNPYGTGNCKPLTANC